MSLLQSYGLLQKMARIEPAEASFDELASFHSQDYLDFCDQLSKTSDQEKYTASLNEKLKTNSSSIEDEYGVEFDCPILPNLSKLISWLAGGSLCKLYLGMWTRSIFLHLRSIGLIFIFYNFNYSCC